MARGSYWAQEDVYVPKLTSLRLHESYPKFVDGIELIIIIIGTFGQSLSANADIGNINIFSALIVWRVIVSSLFLYFASCAIILTFMDCKDGFRSGGRLPFVGRHSLRVCSSS